MNINHLIDFNELTPSDWEELYELTLRIIDHPIDYVDKCKGKLLATLFYEPSTRTMLSFQSAMLRLGGNVIGFDNPDNSSVSKGENLKDTIRTISNYSDIVVIRNPYEGSAYAASLYAGVPVINAGDGKHLHPTQTLADLVTIKKEKGALEGLTIGCCGDLMNGRTVHSLLKAMSLFKNNKFYLISTFPLKTPKYITDIIKKSGNEYIEVRTIEECISELDVIYMTRIQRERFRSAQEYEKQSGIYVLDEKKLKKASKDIIILHPLPKVDEISDEVDYDSRALYFKQAQYGMYVRMALILKLIGKNIEQKLPNSDQKDIKCPNPNCITNIEKYLPTKLYSIDSERKGKACKYCDYRIN